MKRWKRDEVRAECHRLGWKITVVHQIEREEVTAPRYKVGITQHPESFEVVLPDGRTEFIYFDENASRRAISGRPSKAVAFARAQAMLPVKKEEP
ncbi:hypothetical protein ABID65_006726 [Bradyrhizobium sp. S3.9.2]|uniref:hypothetical protein n=1 Tax=Bradyrhizobium sp. S3.9.2 TaxID=3156432 RepID=UPI0033944EF2